MQGQLSNGEWCVKAEGGDRVTIAWCEMGVVKGPWSYDASSRQIVNGDHKKCLAVHPDTRALTLTSCLVMLTTSTTSGAGQRSRGKTKF